MWPLVLQFWKSGVQILSLCRVKVLAGLEVMGMGGLSPWLVHFLEATTFLG